MRNPIKKSLIYLICLTLMLSLTGCQQQPFKSEPLKKTTFVLGTVCDIAVYDKKDEKIIDEAFARISDIEKKMTINNAKTSEIIKLNSASGKEAVKVSSDTFYVLQKGKDYSDITSGRFDITVGPIVKLWNIGTDYAKVPEDDALKEALKHVDYKKLTLSKDTLTAKLEGTDMKVDLGAIAKGYAADEAAAILKNNGVEHAIINLGGNILAIGNNPNGSDWKVGVQDPFNPRGEYIGIIKVNNSTLVSSGTYERYFEENGKVYHHIFDTHTGYPADNELVGVTIVTEKSIDGDGLSTSIFVLGLDKGMEAIKRLGYAEALFVTKDKKVYISPGLKDRFTLTNNDYKISD